nr:SART-1 family protein DOT2 [Tanacetum cinerariifolium]
MDNFPGSLTPMLGDRKVENFLGIKRKYEPRKMGLPKKPESCILLDPACSKEQMKIREIEQILEEEAKY